MLSWFLGALFLSSLFDGAAATNTGIFTFISSGVVTIFVVGGTFTFLYTLYFSAAKTGYGGWRNHALWFILDVWLYMSGIFLIFGPDSLTYLSNGPVTGLTGSGPRSCIIGLQLVFQSALGIFAIYSANAYASLVFGIFGVFNALCLMGSNFLFNYNEPIWLLNEPECVNYFEVISIQRCNDEGYLEFLRIIGSIAIIAEGYLVIISLLAYATAVPAYGHPGEYPAGAVGVPGATTGVGYPAGAYGTATTQQTTTGVPVTTQPYATTTTTQPYATTTTTHTTQVQ